jgi:hypothetical protein
MKKYLAIIIFFFLTIVFFYPVLLKGLLPVPADTIVGMYSPYRDFFASSYPNGIPFKNFLLTDPVRQQFPWRELAVSVFKNFEFPIWNPYSFCGTPLLANFQTAAFNIFNIFLFILPFKTGWSINIILQIFLSSLFLFIYLKNLKLSTEASLFGAIAFSFSGFSIAWLEWGTIVQTALWLPLVLFLTDKLFEEKKRITYLIGLVLSLSFSLFSGHPQIFFYVVMFFTAYFLCRFLLIRKKRFILDFFLIIVFFLIITAVQWIPSYDFLMLSARSVDLNWHTEGWFIPWQNLVQFIVPDFFGNPATLNYWGIWNYGEFIGYVGILPFIFAIFCLFYRKDKKTLFFGTVFFLSLLFSFPTFLAKLPYLLNIPIITGFQPTRLIFITDFCLAVLAAMGIDYFYLKKKNIFYPTLFIGLILILLWFVVNPGFLNQITLANLLISRNNLYLPTILFIISAAVLFINFIKRKKELFYTLIIVVLILDLFRFGWKFLPFSQAAYLYPETKSIKFLKEQKQPFRIMSTDSRILPPNFSVFYKLQTIDGYDSLYLLRYGELMAAMGREKPDISSPFGFNRIIQPQNYKSSLINLLNVKYILSFENLSAKNLTKVFEEGTVKIYENTDAYERMFFVGRTVSVKDKKSAIDQIFYQNYALNEGAIIEFPDNRLSRTWSVGKVKGINYTENKIIAETENNGEGFLILTDSFYPSWHVKIDNKESKIYRTYYNFRGIIVPAGKHTIEFYSSLF